MENQSSLREVALETGAVTRLRSVPDGAFAEGIAIVGDDIYQLTWQNQRGFVWNRAELTLTESFPYEGEGWGLCFDGELLVMSNGSDLLTFRDPSTFEIVGSVNVTIVGGPLYGLNELECAGGFIYANVWRSETMVRINPVTGEVEARIQAAGLLEADEAHSADVLNGIAYKPQSGNFLITGKYWPWLFEVDFRPAPGKRW